MLTWTQRSTDAKSSGANAIRLESGLNHSSLHPFIDHLPTMWKVLAEWTPLYSSQVINSTSMMWLSQAILMPQISHGIISRLQQTFLLLLQRNWLSWLNNIIYITMQFVKEPTRRQGNSSNTLDLFLIIKSPRHYLQCQCRTRNQRSWHSVVYTQVILPQKTASSAKFTSVALSLTGGRRLLCV